MISFRGKLVGSMTMGLVAILLLFFGVTQTFVSIQISSNLKDSLELSSLQLQHNFKRRLADITSSLRHIATEKFITRYIVDDTRFHRTLMRDGLERKNILSLESKFQVFGATGAELYSNNKSCPAINEGAVQSLLRNEKKVIFQSFHNDQCRKVVVAIPIYYQKYIEGVLVSYLPLDQFFNDIAGSVTEQFGVSLVEYGDIIIGKGVTSDKYIEREIEEIVGLKLRIFMDKNLVRNATIKSFSFVGLSVILVFFIALAFIHYKLAPIAADPLKSFEAGINNVMKDRKTRIENVSVVREIASVQSAFNELLDHIDDAEKDSMVRAHQAGIAENAVSVLHNIGNILTSITMKLENNDFSDELKKYSDLVHKIYDSLVSAKQNSAVDQLLSSERGEKLLLLLETISSEVLSIAKEVERVDQFSKNQVSHISDIISLQQTYAVGDFEVKTKVDPLSIIDDTLELYHDRIEKYKVTVEKNCHEDLCIFVNQYGLAQTLSNFVVNALESMHHKYSDHGPFEAKLILTLEAKDELVCISIEDNGMGVDPDHMNQLFRFGFTTKRRSSGFGLHDCANYIKSNHGNIDFISDGVGQGAKVVVSFPEYIPT